MTRNINTTVGITDRTSRSTLAIPIRRSQNHGRWRLSHFTGAWLSTDMCFRSSKSRFYFFSLSLFLSHSININKITFSFLSSCALSSTCLRHSSLTRFFSLLRESVYKEHDRRRQIEECTMINGVHVFLFSFFTSTRSQSDNPVIRSKCDRVNHVDYPAHSMLTACFRRTNAFSEAHTRTDLSIFQIQWFRSTVWSS